MKLIHFIISFLALTLPLTIQAQEVKMKTETAIVGGGCFWCLEALYETVPGILTVVSGYTGGKKPHPTYEQVCSGTSGHAEVVQITFNPAVISYSRLLELFWQAHDPTTVNRQGADVGTQYRSIIVCANETQKKVAEASKQKAAALFKDPISTEISALTEFYPAEEYHQDYFRLNPNQGYCRAVIKPKVDHFKP